MSLILLFIKTQKSTYMSPGFQGNKIVWTLLGLIAVSIV
jgi:hypothetical protein